MEKINPFLFLEEIDLSLAAEFRPGETKSGRFL